jgi:hypothetical protein
MSVVRALQNMGIPDGSVAGEVLDGTVILFDEVIDISLIHDNR